MNDTASALASAQRMRHADAELLSLALMQARNQTLAWLALFEPAAAAPEPLPSAHFEPALWIAGHAGWLQERWIARNLQRGRGQRADAGHAPLASIDPDADRWWAAEALAYRAAWVVAPPTREATPAYLA